MVTYLFLTFLLILAKKGCTFYKRLAFWVWKWWSFDLTFFFVFHFFKEKNFYFPDTLVSNFVDILQERKWHPKTGGASSNAVPQAPSILPKSGAGAIAFHLRPCLVYNSKTFITRTSFFTKNKDFSFFQWQWEALFGEVIVSSIQSWKYPTSVYTPGLPALAHPRPLLTIPSCMLVWKVHI